MKKSSGFTLVEALLVVVILALIGLVGYNLYSMQTAKDDASNESAPQTAISAPAINDTADLDKAATVLDSTPDVMSESEVIQIENQATF